MGLEKFLNMQALHEITDGDSEIEAKFVEMFMETAAACLAQLKPLVDADPAGDWQKVVHTLRGASANIYAETMSDICKHAEPMGADKDARKKAYERLSAELARYEEILKEDAR